MNYLKFMCIFYVNDIHMYYYRHDYHRTIKYKMLDQLYNHKFYADLVGVMKKDPRIQYANQLSD